MWMILCHTTSGLVVIYSSYKICPRGESSKKVFLPSGCWPFKGSPPIPNPIHSAFRDFFWRSVDPRYWFYVLVIVNFLLESPILPYYCCYVGVWTKCQPDKMPTGQNANLGWHFVRDFFSVVGILSGPTFWLAFCPDHLNMSWQWGGPVTSFCLLLTVVGEK